MKTTALPSNRSFGWLFAGVLAFLALFHPWTLLPAALFVLVTLTRDEWLTPLNRAWMKLGELMGMVVSPIVLGIIFYAVFTPFGVVMRLFGRDALTRSYAPALKSYWVKRDPPGPADGSFRNPF